MSTRLSSRCFLVLRVRGEERLERLGHQLWVFERLHVWRARQLLVRGSGNAPGYASKASKGLSGRGIMKGMMGAGRPRARSRTKGVLALKLELLWEDIRIELEVLAEEFSVPAALSVPYAGLTLLVIRMAAPGLSISWIAAHPWTAAVVCAVAALVAAITYLTEGLDWFGRMAIYLVGLGSMFAALGGHPGPSLWLAWALQTLYFLFVLTPLAP